MKNISAIITRELKSYFVSPIAYAVLFVFLLISGYYFYIYIYEIGDACRVIPYLLSFIGFISLFTTPFITMRLVAEEKKTGTIEVLLTNPVLELEISAGKFLASLLLYLSIIFVTFFYVIILSIYGSPDFGPIFSGYLGLILLEATFLSVGLLFSTMTSNQIIAAILTFGVLLLFWLIGWVGSYFQRPYRDILQYLSFIEHYEDFGKGIIDTKHIIFYLSVIGFNIFLSSKIMESRKRN